jgi:4-amino-4-deoxy-L-arabinose transferase-like glycosyltransferase
MHNRLLLGILIFAFGLRLAVRVAYGEEYFWNNSYGFFQVIASNLIQGEGLFIEWWGPKWAFRTPVYPVFLAILTLGGKNFWAIVLPQTVVGAGTCLCAFGMAKELFGRPAGLVAAGITAIYPYYVMHDTALQETGLFNFLTALSIFLLLRARNANSVQLWALSGLALGLAVLTRPVLAPLAALAMPWAVWFGSKTWRVRLRIIFALSASLALTVGSWLTRNYLVAGAPVLTSEAGRNLWDGNNAYTFSHFPERSIDLSDRDAYNALSPAELQELEKLANNEIAQSDWFARRGLQFIRDNPWLTLRRAFLKILVAFSWKMSPAREPAIQAIYFLSYFPVFLLGLAGMILSRSRRAELSLFAILFLCFIAITAVYWAHTSHRSYLDVYFIVFSSHPIETVGRRLQVHLSARQAAGG